MTHGIFHVGRTSSELAPAFVRRRWINAIILIAITAGLVGCSSNDVKNADRLNGFQLIKAATSALKDGRTEDAGFLGLAGLTRFAVDFDVYPPTESGKDNPKVKAAVHGLVVGTIMEQLKKDPTAFANANGRFAKWLPRFDSDYDPGWKYAKALSLDKATSAALAGRSAMFAQMEVERKLTANVEYQQLTDSLAEATKVEEQCEKAAEGSSVVNPVSIKVAEKLLAAQNQKFIAAKGIQKIEWEVNPSSRWHATMRWRAEDYFNDKQVIALCHAIELNDVPEMERLIAAGANVSAVGKESMTPLLWAFPDEKLERFACLLRHGADPNVVIQSDFKTVGLAFHLVPNNGAGLDDIGCHAGESITLLASRAPNLDYLKLVLEHGGDPNQASEKSKEAPLDAALKRFLPDSKERVAALLAKGADPVRYCERRKGYPATEAIELEHFDVALSLLEAASERTRNQQEVIASVIKQLVGGEWKVRFLKGKQAKDRKALVEWLQKNGAPINATPD